MKPAPFEYQAPATLREAIDLLASDPEAAVIAGGQSPIPVLAFRLAAPSMLVDLRRVSGLGNIAIDESGVRLGARVRWRDIEGDRRLLTVFQRTPQWAAPLRNGRISKDEMNRIRANYPEIFERCQETYGCFIHATDPRATLEVTPNEREAFWEKLYGEPGFGIWMGNFRDILVDREANALISDFIARKIRQRVNDSAVAEKLIPKNHGFGTRRVPLESGYYEVYNQPNVKLVDINETPIERITPTGVKTSDTEYEFDIIIYATGFDAITGAFDRIDIRGTDGASLKEKWRDGPQTFLGILVDGFPNMLMVMGPHAGLGNFPRAVEYTADWVTGLIRFAHDRGLTRIEAAAAGAVAWTDHVIASSEGLLFTEVDSWMTGINRNVEGKQTRRIMRYSGGHPAFRKRCDAVAAEGYRELVLA